MIQKSNLDRLITHHKNYESLIRRVEDAIVYSMQFNSFKFIYFVNEAQRKIIQDCINHYEGILCYFDSKVINGEYKLALIYCDIYDPKELHGTILYSVKYNTKFNTIKHQDVLGSLMNLGIERNMIGDIFVNDGVIYFEIDNVLKKYIEDNLVKIKNVRVKLEIVRGKVEKVQNFLELTGIIKSTRLDAVVAQITNLSRSNVKDYILSSNVKVNQVIENNISYEVQNEDIISIKKYGRFKIILEGSRSTKKNNIYFKYYKYI